MAVDRDPQRYRRAELRRDRRTNQLFDRYGRFAVESVTRVVGAEVGTFTRSGLIGQGRCCSLLSDNLGGPAVGAISACSRLTLTMSLIMARRGVWNAISQVASRVERDLKICASPRDWSPICRRLKSNRP